MSIQTQYVPACFPSDLNLLDMFYFCLFHLIAAPPRRPDGSETMSESRCCTWTLVTCTGAQALRKSDMQTVFVSSLCNTSKEKMEMFNWRLFQQACYWSGGGRGWKHVETAGQIDRLTERKSDSQTDQLPDSEANFGSVSLRTEHMRPAYLPSGQEEMSLWIFLTAPSVSET